MTDIQAVWIRQAQQGNELAAFHLYESYSKAMYNTLVRMVADTEQANDLLQESFIKAFRNLANLDDEKAFGGWLKRIVINTGLEYLRKRQLYFQEIDEHTMEMENEPTYEVDIKVLHGAIKKLPLGCRTVLTLHVFEGYKHQQIAKELGITESTSKTQFRHAKLLLKNILQETYEKEY